MPVADHVEKGNQNMEAGVQRPAVLAQTLDYISVLLRDHDGGFRQNDNDENRQEQSNEQPTSHGLPSCHRIQTDSPSTRSTVHRWPRATLRLLLLRAFQEEPRSSTLPKPSTSMSSSAVAVSPIRESTSMSGILGPKC